MRRSYLIPLAAVLLYAAHSVKKKPYFLHSSCNHNLRITTQVFPSERTEYGIMQFDRTPLTSLSFVYINAGFTRRVAECEIPRNWLLV